MHMMESVVTSYGPVPVVANLAGTSSVPLTAWPETGQAPAAPHPEAMVATYMPMVKMLARRLHRRTPDHVELEELISAGVVGLLDAMKKFDGERHVQFQSYAQFRIQGAMLDGLRAQDWSPRDLRRRKRALENAVCTLSLQLKRAPEETEVAAQLSLSLPAYQQLLTQLSGLEIGSLTNEHNENSAQDEAAALPAPEVTDPFHQCFKAETRGHVASAIENLSEKERLVVTLYYYEQLTMREIGQVLGVVESRVSQLHSGALLRLRSSLGRVRGMQPANGTTRNPEKPNRNVSSRGGKKKLSHDR